MTPFTNTLSLICSIRSIVCLNLPSFSGGLNPWGTPNGKKLRDVSSDSLYLYLLLFLTVESLCRNLQLNLQKYLNNTFELLFLDKFAEGPDSSLC